MDAYSHHPYTPGGSTRVKPGQLPNNPARCVTLGNLGQLTRLFPSKPFYLTEFGYNTQYCRWFGVTVSKADQARYLREAYSYARRYRQVKALLWFLVDDWNPTASPTDKAGDGVYMGVRTVHGRAQAVLVRVRRRQQTDARRPRGGQGGSLLHALRRAHVPVTRGADEPDAHAAVARAVGRRLALAGDGPHRRRRHVHA